MLFTKKKNNEQIVTLMLRKELTYNNIEYFVVNDILYTKDLFKTKCVVKNDYISEKQFLISLEHFKDGVDIEIGIFLDGENAKTERFHNLKILRSKPSFSVDVKRYELHPEQYFANIKSNTNSLVGYIIQ